MTTFGQYIRNLRELLHHDSSDYSLRKVAAKLKIQPSYLSKIERGLENPSEEMIVKIAKEYKQDLDVLLAMNGKVSSRLQHIIIKNPVAFAKLIDSLEHSPENSILRIVREVRDGNW